MPLALCPSAKTDLLQAVAHAIVGEIQPYGGGHAGRVSYLHRGASRAIDSVMVPAFMRPDLDRSEGQPALALGSLHKRDPMDPLALVALRGHTRQPSRRSDFGASAQSSRRAPVRRSSRRQIRLVGLGFYDYEAKYAAYLLTRVAVPVIRASISAYHTL